MINITARRHLTSWNIGVRGKSFLQFRQRLAENSKVGNVNLHGPMQFLIGLSCFNQAFLILGTIAPQLANNYVCMSASRDLLQHARVDYHVKI